MGTPSATRPALIFVFTFMLFPPKQFQSGMGRREHRWYPITSCTRTSFDVRFHLYVVCLSSAASLIVRPALIWDFTFMTYAPLGYARYEGLPSLPARCIPRWDRAHQERVRPRSARPDAAWEPLLMAPPQPLPREGAHRDKLTEIRQPSSRTLRGRRQSTGWTSSPA